MIKLNNVYVKYQLRMYQVSASYRMDDNTTQDVKLVEGITIHKNIINPELKLEANSKLLRDNINQSKDVRKELEENLEELDTFI